MGALLPRAPALSAANTFNSWLVAAVLIPAGVGWGPIVWASLITLFSLYTVSKWLKYRGHPRPKYVSRAAIRRLELQGLAMGVAWGIGCFAFFPASVEHQMFLCIVIAGMSAGGASALAPVPKASLYFLLASLTPVVARFALGGEVLHWAMAGMGFIFFVALAVSARSSFLVFAGAVTSGLLNKQLVGQLDEAHQTLTDAIDQAPEAFALFEPDGSIALWNDRFLRTLSLPPGMVDTDRTYPELIRTGLRMSAPLTPPEHLKAQVAEEIACFKAAAAGGETQPRVWRFGTDRWLQTTHRRTRAGGVVTVHVDITDLKLHEEKLLEARLIAESANRSKSQFLANMSHELRTPLNAVIGFSEMMRDEVLGPLGNEKYKEYAEDIAGGGRHLLSLINDILDIAKIEAGKVELSESEVDFAEIARSCLTLLRERAGGKSIRLLNALPPNLPKILGDERRLKQVLLNLLSNAVKFTEDGGEVRLLAEVDQAGFRFVVEDTGIGIAEDDIARVLTPFAQADMDLARRHEGTGLGLPLAKSFLELHGGKLAIDSQEGVGTRILCTLPQDRLLPDADDLRQRA